MACFCFLFFVSSAFVWCFFLPPAGFCLVQSLTAYVRPAPLQKQRKPYRKYEKYDLPVDPAQGDRATKLKIWSFKRPHMRAFHCAWFGFFCAFFIWFAIAPLLPVVKDTLGITKQDIWTSNICSVASTVLLRFINGPLCDKYGPRITMSTMLVAASIPCAMIGLVNSTLGLCICR